MIQITPALQAAFAPHARNYGDVVITNVPAPINALKMLLDLGLPVSKRIVVNEFETPYNHFDVWGHYGKEKFISSYAYLEEGTENDCNQNNVATYNPTMGTLTIHICSGANHIGRGHWIGYAKKWLDASYCFAA
jgi:hypothetical protein